LNTTRSDGTDARLDHLTAASEISERFATGLPRKTIQGFVEVAALAARGTYISYSTTEARMLFAENDAPPVSFAALLRERQRFAAELPTTALSTL